MVDLNLDGLLDLVVVNRWTSAEVWRQTGAATGGWLEVRLAQPEANRDAIGAVIEIKRGAAVERHEITAGGGHASGSIGWLHFGLGDAKTAEMRVIWPGGDEGGWMTLSAGGFYILRPGKDAEVWVPG